LTQAPTINRLTHGSCHSESSNGFEVMVLGHSKSADWVNLASAATGPSTHSLYHFLKIRVIAALTQKMKKSFA
jgi:hypothetical protein